MHQPLVALLALASSIVGTTASPLAHQDLALAVNQQWMEPADVVKVVTAMAVQEKRVINPLPV